MYVSTMTMNVPMVRAGRTLGTYGPYGPRMRRIRRHSTLGLSNSPALSIGVKAAETAVSFIPVVGPILAPLIGTITGMFTAAHAQAVANEAAGLNAAAPAFFSALQQIVDALNSGQIGASDALSSIDQSVSMYYGAIQSIMQKAGSCPIDSSGNMPVNSKGLPQGLNPCNGPCAVGCQIEADAVRVKNAIAAGGGSVLVARALAAHAGFQGIPPFTLSIAPPGVASSISGLASGIPTWVWVAGAGGLFLFVVMGMGNK